MLWFLLASVATIFGVRFFYIKYIRWSSYWEKRGVVCEKSWGPFGAALFQRKTIQEAVWEIYNKHHEERCVGFYQMNRPALLIKDTNLIKQITTKNFEYFAYQKGRTTKLGIPLKDTSNNDLAFAPNNLEALFDSISNRAEDFAAYFVKRTTNNIAMEMKDAFSRFSNDVLASCILGVTCSSLENKNNQLFRMTKRAQVLNNVSNTRTFFWKTIKNSVKSNKPNDPILSFLSGNTKLNKDDLTTQALVFYLGVSEMVSTLCSFMAYELAVNADVQGKLLEEIDWALKENAGGLTYGVVEKMKFLDMVVSEVLRKWPARDRVEMVCREPCALLNGSATLVVENGIKIVVPCLAVQKDPRHFSDPNLFDPERFSDENRGKIRPFTYFPFGYLRNDSYFDSLFTLLTVKVVFCKLLAHFSLQMIERTQIPLKLDRTSCTALAGENGIWLGIKRRK